MKIIIGVPGISAHNLMFDRKYPMVGGKFPKNHPFANCIEPFTIHNAPAPFATDCLNEFRHEGYFASCFPEGDGVTIRCLLGQSNEKLEEDIFKYLIWQE